MHGRPLKIAKLWGPQKPKLLKEYGAELDFPEGWGGGQTRKPYG